MADAADADRELRIVRHFAAPRETVFRAWTERELFRRWFGPADMRVSRCELDARVGGAWMVTTEGAARSHTASGRFLEVAPPSRLAFTWAWHETADPSSPRTRETVVTVEFADRGPRTDMVFVQRLFTDRTGRDNHRVGWEASFTGLDRLLAGGEAKDVS
jgi:uncharacterized protein YndB with AHSA1/START domain